MDVYGEETSVNGTIKNRNCVEKDSSELDSISESGTVEARPVVRRNENHFGAAG